MRIRVEENVCSVSMVQREPGLRGMKLVSAQPEKQNRAHKMCEFQDTERLQLRTGPCDRP